MTVLGWTAVLLALLALGLGAWGLAERAARLRRDAESAAAGRAAEAEISARRERAARIDCANADAVARMTPQEVLDEAQRIAGDRPRTPGRGSPS